jgi:hypothetical protein
MKINIMKKMFNLLLIIISISFIYVTPNLALETATHRAINKRIADKNSMIDQFSLHQYLIKYLGMQDGVDTKFNYFSIGLWLEFGAEEEDTTPRYLRHFLNPINNQGLTWNSKTYPSARDWALMPVGSQGFTGNFSWNDARQYYYTALTSADKATRETNFAKTFQAVGQVMHLVQDMSVPAHTRSNSHGSGDVYERWFLNPDVPLISSYSVKSTSYFTIADSSLLIPNLFDTGQYDGSNPGITTSSSSIGLAEYTNANFLSAGTIFKGFTYPAYSPGITVTENPENIGNKEVLYLKKIGDGEAINYFARAGRFYRKLPADYKALELMVDDNKVHENYAQFLLPRAIGYSSQVLSYFFRGQLEVEMGDGNLKVKNASTDIMTGGTFELYYDNANGERNKVTITDGAAVSSLAPGGNPQTITFTPPPDGAASYMLVYSGTLGNETNAVAGKFIPAENELVVITVALNGIAGETLTKKSVLVWNPANNSLQQAPIDYENTAFQKWFTVRKQTGNDLYGQIINAGLSNIVDGITPCNYPPDMTLTNEAHFERVEENLDPPQDQRITISGYMIINVYGSQNIYGPYQYYPQSYYAPVLLPGSPEQYAGFRIKHDATEYRSEIWWYDEPWVSEGIDNGDFTDTFYSPFGIMGSFSGWSHAVGGDVFNHDSGPINWNIRKIYDVANPYAYDVNRKKYADMGQKMNGKFSENVIANAMAIQYVSRDETQYYSGDPPYADPVVTSRTYHDRIVLVHSQAIFREEGISGVNWITEGNNIALDAQLIEAIEMAYTLNGISANEIREASISIQIVK